MANEREPVDIRAIHSEPDDAVRELVDSQAHLYDEGYGLDAGNWARALVTRPRRLGKVFLLTAALGALGLIGPLWTGSIGPLELGFLTVVLVLLVIAGGKLVRRAA